MSSDPVPDQVHAYNDRAAALRDAAPDIVAHPCLFPRLVHADDLQANDYNPNQVPNPELRLLSRSIDEDGLTMPIVTYERDDGTFEIVDGYHRYYVLTDEDWLDRIWVPVSVIDKDIGERMASTVRHNRARGDHTTELMGELVEAMESTGKETAEIAADLGMEKEELVRLKQVVGAAGMLASDQYAQSWGVQEDDDDA